MERWSKRALYGWGRFPVIEARCARPERQGEILEALQPDGVEGGRLAYGLGRSYGDTALLSDGGVILMERLDRMLGFDPETGWARVEAGVSIQSLVDVFLPRGFFPYVVPGTFQVTVGGAIANDIHGKNHHVDGTFADHVRRVELLTGSGEVVICDAQHHPELFWATVGGLGLTGVILSAEVRLRAVASPYIEMESIRVESLDHFFEVSADSAGFTHTVSWIDCVTQGKAMGRGIFMRGGHAAAGATLKRGPLGDLGERLSPYLKMPIDAPNWLMNKATMRLFNEAYFHKHPKGKIEAVTAYAPFFCPLDFVQDWNRGYGPRGFLQYQLVVPSEPEHRTIRQILEAITASGMGSFLAVIKEFGEQTHPGLSFPQPGVTLALDFPNYGAPLFELFERLDEMVLNAGGRLYLGKDSRLSREMFCAMYPDWARWKATRDAWDPQGRFASDQGRRLGLVEG
ncbi:FAD-binding oxidoreductase, partial [Myxococcota bacterium]|nr:FAD-binding oxidoreductase [Myxococcota bacterium]